MHYYMAVTTISSGSRCHMICTPRRYYVTPVMKSIHWLHVRSGRILVTIRTRLCSCITTKKDNNRRSYTVVAQKKDRTDLLVREQMYFSCNFVMI